MGNTRSSLRYIIMLVGGLFLQALFTTIGCANSSVLNETKLKNEYEHLIRNERIDQALAVAESGGPDEEGERTVYLTFDDGPSVHTSKVLDLLAKEQIPATFFVLGDKVERAPETARRIIEEGHVLGNHTYNHQYKELYSDFAGFWDQLLQTESVLERHLSQTPRLVRAPGGTFTNFDAFYYQFLSSAGYTVVDWNVDSGDSRRKGVTSQEIVDNIKASVLHERAIVLLHDGPGHGASVEALPEIIAYYRDQGYTFAALDEAEQRPVQFRLGESKWGREKPTFTQYKNWMAAMSEHNAGLDEKTGLAEETEAENQHLYRTSSISTHIPSSKPDKWEADMPSASVSLNERSSPTLQITVNGITFKLESGQYKFERGRFAVPFSFIAEHFSEKETAAGEDRASLQLHTFNSLAVFEPTANLVQVDGLNGLKQHYVSDVFTEEGEVYVGLRMAFEWLGYTITDYSIGEDVHHVQMQKNIISLPFEV